MGGTTPGMGGGIRGSDGSAAAAAGGGGGTDVALGGRVAPPDSEGGVRKSILQSLSNTI